jgi:hypothetical protein
MLLTAELNGLIRWNISGNDPVSWRAIAETGVSVVNPLVDIDDSKPTVIPMTDGRFHVLTNRLTLLTTEEPGERLFDSLSSWLRLLRLASKQATLPTEIYAISTGSPEHLGVPNTTRKPGTWAISGEFRLHTAVDAAVIASAYSLATESSFPLCNELLLDALQACEMRRHREAILFSAIAIESLAQHELSKAYEAALLADVPPGHLNVVAMNLAGGQTTKKDPIYSLLTEQENFGRLLHEAPLYLLRRSLLCEAPALFAKAKSLYGTRNRLSHGQPVAQANSNLLPVDPRGSNLAAQIAVDVFSWFGQTGFRSPDRKMIEFRV